jgi:hypothetical protein
MPGTTPQHVDRVVGEVAQVAGLPVGAGGPAGMPRRRALPRGEGEHGHGVGQRRAEPAQRRQRPLPASGSPTSTARSTPAAPACGSRNSGDAVASSSGATATERVVEPQHSSRASRPRVDEPTREHGADRMQHRKAVTIPSCRPRRAGPTAGPGGGRRRRAGRRRPPSRFRPPRGCRTPARTDRPANPARRRGSGPSDPGARHDAQRRGQAVLLGRPVEVADTQGVRTAVLAAGRPGTLRIGGKWWP